MTKKLLGLIVNPRAGLGGRVGLKGSDGECVQARALALGAQPLASSRASAALEVLKPYRDQLCVVTFPGEMGADAAAGFETRVIGQIEPGHTTRQDTFAAAAAMRDLPVDLILFAGGDGTARDVYDAVGANFPVLGVPAGVKIHSPVYAIHPRAAGELVKAVLFGTSPDFEPAEVIDLDEEGVREGVVSDRLYGYLSVPHAEEFLQNAKSPSPASEKVAAEEIAETIVDQMSEDILYILGPGTTTRAIADCLGLEKTLIGVDVVLNRSLLLRDAGETALLEALKSHPEARIIITPIGGQGYLFGRGNQQISPNVIRLVGREHIIVVSTTQKMVALRGRPLMVDTGDTQLDRQLEGYLRVVTGYQTSMIYRVAAG